MQYIYAIALPPDVYDWLANSRYPRILHIFEHACNLINERRDVLSVVTLQIGNGPFNLVIEDDVLFSDHLNLQSPISNSSNYLNLGDLTIHTDNAKLWSPRPDWEMLRARRDSILDQLAKLPITDDQKCGGFDTPLNDHSGLLNHQRLPITQSPVSNLQISNSLASALANADLPATITATQKLAGLGMGLTPSGDDFIMGAILAAWILHPAHVAGILAAEVTDVAAALTTSLSGAWLRSAGRGEAGILWHQFFDKLISADPTAIQESMDKILSVGETSGADALAGFISSFMAWSVEART